MTKNFNKKHLWWIIPSAVIAIGIIVVIVALPWIVKAQISHKIREIESEKQVTIGVGDIDVIKCSLGGTIILEMEDITLTANNCADRFLYADQIKAEIQAWHKFRITKELKEFDAGMVDMSVIRRGEYNNYPFLHQHSKTSNKRDYCARFSQLLSAVNRFAPDLLTVKHLQLKTNIDATENDYHIQNLSIKDRQVYGLLTILSGTEQETEWELRGNIDKNAGEYNGEITLTDSTSAAAIPIVEKLENSNIKFNRASFDMHICEETAKHVRLNMRCDIEKLQFFHHYVAEYPVCINNAGGELAIEIFPNKIQIDSSSTLRLNEAAIHPYFLYEKAEKRHIVLKVDEHKCNAQKIFSSLPEGLFVVAPKMKVRGNIDFKLLFDCDFAHINDLKFDFDIRSSDNSFAIVSGADLITKFNKPFVYTFVEGGKSEDEEPEEREVVIDSVENPMFCSFSHIPQYLTNAILVSEDPSFFRHRGYIKDAIRGAMIADLQAGKLMRGGSTISQQLIKNLFLNRKKVFTRKIEELLLVWMIENKSMISKERMFEIYVNIIEWGPMIIGIGEAAEFYFHKQPQELTLGECIYLAGLIRSPRRYAGTFSSEGVPTEGRQSEMRNVANMMAKRGLISNEELASFTPNIHILAPKKVD